MISVVPQKPLSEKWMKAAVVGSLWAVVEIVLGSLLHNVKIPLAGSILSFITVFLVIAFFQLWKVNGMIWRAGVICALMKSLSPSTIILGPMFGILSEALILEILIRCFGKNFFSYTLGGALAVFSALIQKALTLLVLYGWDFVDLLENMVLFAVRQLHIEALQPSLLLFILSGIYLTAGAMAGLLGSISGKNYLKSKKYKPTNLSIKKPSQSVLFNHSEKENHSLLLLLLLLVFLIGGMVLIHRANLLYSALYSLTFIVFTALRYAQYMRFLKKPALWLQLIFLLFFSAFFYQGFTINGLLHREGWILGLKIIFRALLLLTAFSAISRELKNPVVKNILYLRGLQNLYKSLDLAFSSLPGLMEAFSTQPLRLTGFYRFTHTMLNSSRSLFDEFKRMDKNKPTVFVISGKVHAGKSSVTKEVVSQLMDHNLNIRGFITEPVIHDDGLRSYFIKDISSGTREILCSQTYSPGSIKTGRFFFSEKGLLRGRQILKKTVGEPTDMVVVDEIGPLEMKDGGWAPALIPLIRATQTPQLWTVREQLINVALKKWDIGQVTVFTVPTHTSQDIVKYILGHLAEKE
jgi:nucleoside-triphosphatase THEP1